MIDGALFKPCSNPVIGGPTDPPVYGGLSVSEDITRAFVGASCNESSQSRNITVKIGNLVGVGEYSLSDNFNGITYVIEDGITVKQYSSYGTRKGKIIITKDDRANTILFGTFEFEGGEYNDPGKIIKFTSGRFDINYKK
ncbi:MAG: hypothetical protein ACTHMM_02295 [Agriterribacter sp.]